MASFELDTASGSFHIRFRYAGKPFKRSLRLADSREAGRVCGVIEEAIKDVKRGRLEIPADADVGAFLISGGKVAAKTAPQTVSDSCQVSLAGLFSVYERELTAGSKESNSLVTERIHRRHLVGHFTATAIEQFDHPSVQGYVNARSGDGVVTITIRKELATLRMVWNWGLHNKHIKAPLPWSMKNLTFPKGTSREPFQTWGQIERKIDALRRSKKLTAGREAGLWECLYLDEPQVKECLEHVGKVARYPFVRPMFAFCAYTGARRSEILRSELDDWDFKGGTVAIRQKKADTSRTFTLRQVPIHPGLAAVMRAWLGEHPGGPYTICTENRLQIGPRMGTKYFKAALAGSKWSAVAGFHVFRHSLASNMASRGIDQRLIDEIMGHSTGQMAARYRHLLPQKKEDSIHSLFS